MLPEFPGLLCGMEYMPHGHCYFWQTDLITLHAISDGLISVAYFSIPILFLYLVSKRSDLPFRSVLWLFGAFIVACGTTHLFEVVTIWIPMYWISGWVKALTAVVSITCAVALLQIVPAALKLPSPDALRKLNEELEGRVEARTADLKTTNSRLAEEVVQREQAEAEVRRLNESLQNRLSELQTLLDLLPVGIAIAQDAACRDIRANKAFAEMLGISTKQNASLSAPPFEAPRNFKVHGQGRELAPEELPMQRAARDNVPISNFELTISRDDGRQILVLMSALPLRDAEGRSRGCVATAQDITEQRTAEHERLSMERRLQEAQKMESLGVLAGGVAHDFNNLLTGILGNASLARLDLPPGHPTVRASLDNLEHATIRAADLCKQMLAYAGKGRFFIQPISISRLIKETAELLEVSVGRKALLQFELAPDLPAFQGDSGQIRQVLVNLVQNASEAMGDGGGTILISTGVAQVTREFLERLKMQDHGAEGLCVYFEVRDTGCGMDKQTLARIFDPFFTTKFTGRGLGLPAVMGIVRGHHGAIAVESEVDKGTSVKIFFPSTDRRATPPALMAQAETESKGSGSILLVDDEDTVRKVAERVLSNAGYEVASAADGLRAVELFKNAQKPFSAVLLDLTMPVMSGEQTFRALHDLRPEVPVILMSGFNEQDATARFSNRGIAGFLAKPFNAEMMLEKIRDVTRCSAT